MLPHLLDELTSCKRCSFANDAFPPLAPARLANHAKVMFIGENPSWQFGQRVPFDGITNSGKALHQYYLVPLQQAFNLKERDFWITDLFKCRYPKEIYQQKASQQGLIQANAKTCVTSWLIGEIRLVQPAVIVTLGDKEVYQRFCEILGLQCPRNFQKAAYSSFEVEIGGHNCTLVPACHPDISHKNQLKPGPSAKWSKLHRSKFVSSFEGAFKRGGA